jgi:hypothetical protein
MHVNLGGNGHRRVKSINSNPAQEYMMSNYSSQQASIQKTKNNNPLTLH